MNDSASKLPVKTEHQASAATRRPFEGFRREVERLFEDFDRGVWRSPLRALSAVEPFWRREFAVGESPAVDITEGDKAYEVTAELPGMDEKNIEVKVANGNLTIKGEKNAEKEEKKKDYYLRERTFGSFERSFSLPQGVDKEKIEASFKKGVLTITLPKTPDAQKAEKKIEVKPA
ncbi:MAG: Hsp20/alpha crystallin family protein [Reyranella sp.]